MDTVELTVDIDPREPWSEILIAELAEVGFDSFVETKAGFLAYAEATLNVEDAIAHTSLAKELPADVKLTQKVIPQQNWNSAWEENFHPVHIEEYATILAPFHEKSEGVGMIVEIQPQMSFGTGHHQTTWMMTKALFELEKMSTNVLDMGTGTGVLAVVAEKLGAERVLAIDIEEWSAENARENVARNDCKAIECVCGDVDVLGKESFGLIIANINKNILKAHLPTYSKVLDKGGVLLLSGFFSSDVDELVEAAGEVELSKEKVFARDEWAGIQLRKK